LSSRHHLVISIDTTGAPAIGGGATSAAICIHAQGQQIHTARVSDNKPPVILFSRRTIQRKHISDIPPVQKKQQQPIDADMQ